MLKFLGKKKTQHLYLKLCFKPFFGIVLLHVNVKVGGVPSPHWSLTVLGSGCDGSDLDNAFCSSLLNDVISLFNLITFVPSQGL